LAEPPGGVPSRYVPAGVKREVRRRCRFGCVICGLPLYDYDHLFGWSKDDPHLPDEITLLCDRHHREKTQELLPLETVLAANADPYNGRSNVTAPYDLYFPSERVAFTIGSNSFVSPGLRDGERYPVLSIDGRVLLGVTRQADHLLLSLVVCDASGKWIAAIIENQLSMSTDPWDIELVGRRLTIREAQTRFLIDLRFDPQVGINIDHGRLHFDGVELAIDPHGVSVGAATLSGMMVHNSGGGLAVERDEEGRWFAFIG
jgi:trigger factor